MSAGERCEEILRLIDEALGDPSPDEVPAPPVPVPVPVPAS
jgi:hypothetical protein